MASRDSNPRPVNRKSDALPSIFTDDECFIVADDVGMFQLFSYDWQFVDNVTDTLLSFFDRPTPRRVQRAHLSRHNKDVKMIPASWLGIFTKFQMYSLQNSISVSGFMQLLFCNNVIIFICLKLHRSTVHNLSLPS